jgi:metallo-beta-lactamase family protein
VWSTPATRDLCEFMLKDSAHLQEEEALFANKKGYSKHQPALPLYTVEDAQNALPLFRMVDPGRPFTPAPGLTVTLHRAGHILGSSIVEIVVAKDGRDHRLVFSGDLGRYDSLLMLDPEDPGKNVDDLIMESTYGNREHEDKDPRPVIAEIVKQVVARRGVLLIPAFAVGRTQEILLILKQGMDDGSIPRVPVHLDSPMAIDATEIYCKYTDEQRIPHPHPPGRGCEYFFGQLDIVQTVEQSKRLNAMAGPRVIISASGMASGGRIVHHLRMRLPDPKNTVLFVGYQAAGTRGQALTQGVEEVKMFGEMVPVKAEIRQIDALSAHADRSELVRWSGALGRPGPGRVFLTHGEPEAAESLAALLRQTYGWTVHVPNPLEKAELFG